MSFFRSAVAAVTVVVSDLPAASAASPPEGEALFPSHRRFALLPCLSLLLMIACLLGGARVAGAQEVVDLYLPKTIQLKIPPYYPPASYPNEGVEWMAITRTSPGLPDVSSGVIPGSFFYDHTWVSGVRYHYFLTGTRYWFVRVAHQDPQGQTYYTYVHASESVTSPGVNVTPVLVPVTDNQSVDSRYDLRYGDPTFLDHKFDGTAYRGGLFAGFAADPSRVGRAYLKFPLVPSTVPGEKLWPVGGLSVWFERLARTGSGTVASQGASSDNWVQSALTWSSAPVLGGTKSPAITLHYDRNHAEGQWVHLNCLKNIETELAGDLGLTLALVGADETTNTWAYFAKKEFLGGHTASLLYAFGGPGTGTDPLTTGGQGTIKVASLSLSPSSIEGGTALVTDTATGQLCNVIGTVTLNHPAPPGGATVTLTSATPATVTLLSASVVIPEGATTVTFKLRAGAVTTFTSVVVTAAYAGQATATVSVNAPGSGGSGGGGNGGGA